MIFAKISGKIATAVLLMWCLNSCAPQRFVKPLAVHQHAVNLSFGGALFDYHKTTIPMPFLTAAYGYGVEKDLTVFSAFNVTSALYGNFQLEAGATWQILHQKDYFPAISVSPIANVIYRNADARKFYPQLAINVFREYGRRKNMVYISLDNWFETAAMRSNDVKQKSHIILMPSVGHSFVYKNWSYQTEVKIIAPNLSNEGLVIDYKTPFGKHGAFGVYVGCTRRF